MARENDDFVALRNRPALPEVMPSAHEAVGLDLGLGFAQRGGAALDATGGGTIGGYRLGVAGFLTANTGGATFRSGRIAVESPSASWTAEAGDLLSEMRGLARGVRFSRRLTSRWRPGVSFYVNDARVPGDRTAISYRDDLLLTRNVDVRGEAATDGSHFVALRLIAGKGNVETFHRYASDRGVFEHGVAASYNVGRGVNAYGGVRVSTGNLQDRWTMAGIALPLFRGSSFSVEQARNERQASSDVANTFGLQLPFGPVRIIQRYTQTDVALLAGPSIFESGRRQLQSMASYSPNSRLRFTYQVGTQWYAGSDARQWTELESALRMTRSTSIHAVTGFPAVTDPLRLGSECSSCCRMPSGSRWTTGTCRRSRVRLPCSPRPPGSWSWCDAPGTSERLRRKRRGRVSCATTAARQWQASPLRSARTWRSAASTDATDSRTCRPANMNSPSRPRTCRPRLASPINPACSRSGQGCGARRPRRDRTARDPRARLRRSQRQRPRGR